MLENPRRRSVAGQHGGRELLYPQPAGHHHEMSEQTVPDASTLVVIRDGESQFRPCPGIRVGRWEGDLLGLGDWPAGSDSGEPIGTCLQCGLVGRWAPGLWVGRWEGYC